ncbi:hypothetical protein [Escherichia coli]|uniref:hypothetical protein n=1 Tax=Escherichia coli TaxID=562 RepID=UPI0035BE7C6E
MKNVPYMPHGHPIANISKRYDDVEVLVKATSNDGLSVTRTIESSPANRSTFLHTTCLRLLSSLPVITD